MPQAKKSPALDAAPRVRVADRANWRAWLEKHHRDHPPIWLVYEKKSDGRARALTYDQIVEEALCFGWIDSLPRKVSEHESMLYLCKRKPGSVWSALNKRRVQRLMKAGAMAPGGKESVASAKRDGSWSVLDAVERGEIPKDVAAALAQNRQAKVHFEAFPPSAKKGILTWIHLAKQSKTRCKRIEETVRLAARGIRANTPAARGK